MIACGKLFLMEGPYSTVWPVVPETVDTFTLPNLAMKMWRVRLNDQLGVANTQRVCLTSGCGCIALSPPPPPFPPSPIPPARSLSLSLALSRQTSRCTKTGDNIKIPKRRFFYHMVVVLGISREKWVCPTQSECV